MHSIKAHDRYRKKLCFSWLPTWTEDNGLIWLRPYIKKQQYRTGRAILVDIGIIDVYDWKTIAKYGNI